MKIITFRGKKYWFNKKQLKTNLFYLFALIYFIFAFAMASYLDTIV